MQFHPLISRSGLFFKITLLVSLILILAIVSITAISISKETHTITSKLIEKNMTISRQMAVGVKNAFWSLNWHFVEKQMQGIAELSDITFLKLIKPDGEIYLSAGSRLCGEEQVAQWLDIDEKQGLKQIVCPITGSVDQMIVTPVTVGKDRWVLLTGLSLKEVDDARRDIIVQNILLGLVILLTGVLVSFFFARGMLRPVRDLVLGTREIGSGNLDYRIKIKSSDEIGNLADAFNKMAQDLKRTTASRDQLAAEINERRQAERALRESEEKFSKVFHYAPMMISVSQIEDGTYLDVNNKFCEVSGFTREEAIGNSSVGLKWVTPEDRDRIKKELEAHQKIRRVEFKRKAKNGKEVYCLYYGELVTIDNQVRLLSIALDITEQKRLEAYLQRAQKMEAIGELVGGVAHDLNNILSGLVSYPELMLLDLPGDSPLRKPVLTIQKSGQKAAAIVQDLLTMARRGVAVTEIVNLNDIILEYLNSPEYNKLKKFHPAVRLEKDLATDLPNVSGSPVHLSKTIMNLVSNAAEAMPNGGTIHISTANRRLDKPVSGYSHVEKGEYVVFSISDTGEGILPEDKERIFEPFYTKKKMGRSGTGLGMTVVLGTVTDHKGYIDIWSQKGKGTVFTLYFPVTREMATEQKTLTSIETYMGKKETILVVDDVQEQREIASGMLEKLNYCVASVSSGEKAVEYLKESRVDLLILDMIMDPGIDGLETYRRILELNPGQKAIIASGFSETNRVKEVQKIGAGRYVKKPYALEEIGIAVKAALKSIP
jgi:two-component system cell cycle sensor histidine kinase/response regulator CckA